MGWSIALILASSLYLAASRCPDPRLREATIGGDTITASLWPHKKPVKFAQVRLYSSSGKTAWVGMTDKDGGFTINHLAPDVYRLEVRGWGSTTIRLNPELNKMSNGQIPVWSIQLMDHECVAFSEVLD